MRPAPGGWRLEELEALVVEDEALDHELAQRRVAPAFSWAHVEKQDDVTPRDLERELRA